LLLPGGWNHAPLASRFHPWRHLPVVGRVGAAWWSGAVLTWVWCRGRGATRVRQHFLQDASYLVSRGRAAIPGFLTSPSSLSADGDAGSPLSLSVTGGEWGASFIGGSSLKVGGDRPRADSSVSQGGCLSPVVSSSAPCSHWPIGLAGCRGCGSSAPGGWS